MMITRAFQRNLIAKSHALRPVIMIAQKGITDNHNHDIDSALNTHELIKIKMTGIPREEQSKLVEQICEQHAADKVQHIGHTLVIYRKNKEK